MMPSVYSLTVATDTEIAMTNKALPMFEFTHFIE